MSMHKRTLFATLALLGCGSEEVPAEPVGRQVQINVAPLELSSITDARYSLVVRNVDGQVVWSKADLLSSEYGDGKGALTYIGTCDADSNPNTVTLELDALYDGADPIPDTEWRDPTPVSLTTTCRENADVLLEFNLVVMRSADQGFFDIAVTFDDIFCSAKFDCLGSALLHNPATNERDTTLVFAFACAAGEGEQTTLYLDDLEIACADGTTYTINPTLGPGNQGGQPPLLFQVGTYWGQEQFGNLDKCYWNTAIGIDLSVLAPTDAGCVLTATGTATSQVFLDNATPSGVVWPIIEWSVPLTNAQGDLICGENPLDGEGSGVVTGYTDQVGEVFDHLYQCGEDPGELSCAGDAQVLNGEPLQFAEAPGGFTIQVGATESDVYPLPPGYTLSRCCVEACCSTP